MKKKWFSAIILISTAIIFFVIILFTDGVGIFLENIQKINIYWFLGAVSMMFIYWLLEAVILNIFVRQKYKNYTFGAVFRVSMIGQFFNAITPFSSGGQPIQFYALTQDGVSSGEAGSMLVMKFIVHQVTLVLYSFILIIWKLAYFADRVDKFVYLAIIGFSVNFFVIVLLYLFVNYTEMTRNMIHFALKTCSKFKICSYPDKLEKKVEKELEYFKEHSNNIKSNVKILISTGVLTFIQLTSFFMIAYFIYRSFGLSGESLINIFVASAFVTMIISAVPLPGGVGGAEGSFFMLFNMFFAQGKILPAIFLWRFVTLYMNIIVGGIISALAPEKPMKNSEIL
ncbi:MAG TPA: hypothetical protein DEP72_04115 [Clostridiales bacterium]|nr:MAG: hypothetical protein A2Y18_04395 [Clostridiales bacterium GWD2_32_19]HCC07328.1 hypothetical protein [Clostridiales bacterium]